MLFIPTSPRSRSLTLMLATGVIGNTAYAASIDIGPSGQTYTSSAIQCAGNPVTGDQSPVIEAGLFNPKRSTKAGVSLNGTVVGQVTADSPATNVWLADGNNTVVISLNRKTADRYTFTVQPGICALPDTSGNTFSADGSLEYAASGKSYATVVPACAMNPATGMSQPYVNLFDNGTYLINVSVNGVPLTQLNGTTRRSTPVFLGAGINVISAANGTISTDYYTRDGGNGTCVLP
jgi:hypothetical protein